MDKEKALEIISMIADGYNPYGDENSTQNLPELHPVTIRALCVAIASLLSHTDKSVLIKNYRTWDRIELAKIASGPLQKHLIDQEKKMIFNASAKSDFDILQTANEMNLDPDKLEGGLTKEYLKIVEGEAA